MTNNISLKSSGPWYTIEAADHDDAVAKLLALLGDQRPSSPVPLPTLIGYAQVWYEAQLNIGLSGLAQGTAQPAPVAPPVAAEPAPWDVEPPAQEWQQPPPAFVPPAQSAPPVQQAPPAAAPQGGMPNGVKVWQGPNPNPGKEQYTVTFFQVPFIQDPATRTAFNDEMKATVWAKPADTTTKPWTFMGVKNGNETAVPAIIAKYAALGAFS